jgi:hypothetical protein
MATARQSLSNVWNVRSFDSGISAGRAQRANSCLISPNAWPARNMPPTGRLAGSSVRTSSISSCSLSGASANQNDVCDAAGAARPCSCTQECTTRYVSGGTRRQSLIIRASGGAHRASATARHEHTSPARRHASPMVAQ